MKIDKVVITPDPPKKGQSIMVQLYFTLGEVSGSMFMGRIILSSSQQLWAACMDVL